MKHARRHQDILLFLEVAETRIPAEKAVEHLLKGHLPHVTLQEIDLLAPFLRVLARKSELEQRKIVADHSKAPARQFDGMQAPSASQVKHDSSGLDAERISNEVYLAHHLAGCESPLSAHEVF